MKKEKYTNYSENLTQEAQSFDHQIVERVKNGHIPDLQNCEDCDYFYNNTWRRKFYVELDFYEQFKLIRNATLYNLSSDKSNYKILEVGCGPGYHSLELAREGFNVTGIDLSQSCIDVANSTARHYSPKLLGHNLNYKTTDFFELKKSNTNFYDMILFVGALHHFPDQDSVNQCCNVLLKHSGVVVCHEPARDLVSKKNAIVNILITKILKFCNCYFEDVNANSALDDINEEIEKKYNELKYENEGQKLQSVNDNEAGYKDMIKSLKTHYKQKHFEWRYGLFHEIIGGLRLPNEKMNEEIALFIKQMDRIMCETSIVDPNEFFFIGENTN